MIEENIKEKNVNINEKLSDSFKKAGLSANEINSMFSGIAKMRADEKSFQCYFEESWGSAFIASECFYVIISQAYSAFTNYISSISEEFFNTKKNTFTALNELYRRASQQYLEIITLVKNGFSDGAFARWRSMYELYVITAFIAKYGEEVAEKFIEASDTQDRYDWAMASNIFPETKRHVTFGDILKNCDMDTEVWKENYTVANQTVHASPQGTFGRLGTQDGSENISPRSDYGIAAPAIHSANTLALISSTLFSIFPEEKTMEKMAAATKWLDELIEIYCNIHDTLYPEE